MQYIMGEYMRWEICDRAYNYAVWSYVAQFVGHLCLQIMTATYQL